MVQNSWLMVIVRLEERRFWRFVHSVSAASQPGPKELGGVIHSEPCVYALHSYALKNHLPGRCLVEQLGRVNVLFDLSNRSDIDRK